ncbi:MAG TPA: thioesterase domain-containing protein [Candidatus Dormibacteraeota bacterium]|jgi:thioesterase domain-containing protein|nr:thioesterase domain-containing protein [Candidatus Dormibacteraeota bacterium]
MPHLATIGDRRSAIDASLPDTPELAAVKRALLQKYRRPGAAAGARPEVMEPARVAADAALASSTRTPVIPLQPGGSKRPFFYLHVHWQGGAFYCFSLARALGPDQPFHILDPYRFDGLSAPPSIEAMAAEYVATMRRIQPEGPYAIGAFCGASLYAYEMAQQLRAQGQKIDLLLFIDPMAGPIRSMRAMGVTIRRVGRLLGVGEGRQLNLFLSLRFISRKIRRARDEYTDHADRLMREWRAKHPRRLSPLPAAGAMRQDWLAVFIWAVSGYAPRPYRGKVTYLFARENHDRRKLWWGQVRPSDGVDIRLTPGTHESCRTDHLDDLAEQIRSCLSEREASERWPASEPAPAATPAN